MKAIAILSLLFLACNQSSTPTVRVVTRVDTMKVNVHDTIRINTVDTIRFVDTVIVDAPPVDWVVTLMQVDSVDGKAIISGDTSIVRRYAARDSGSILYKWIQIK